MGLCGESGEAIDIVMQKIGMKYEGTLRQSRKNNQGIVDSARYSLIKAER